MTTGTLARPTLAGDKELLGRVQATPGLRYLIDRAAMSAATEDYETFARHLRSMRGILIGRGTDAGLSQEKAEQDAKTITAACVRAIHAGLYQ